MWAGSRLTITTRSHTFDAGGRHTPKDGWYWSRGNGDAVLSHAFVIREGWLWVPLRPIWPGIVINTLFYAVVVWLLTCIPFVLRRLNRIRRGLCPKCEYPMGESAVCTECGKALPASRTSRNIIA